MAEIRGPYLPKGGWLYPPKGGVALVQKGGQGKNCRQPTYATNDYLIPASFWWISDSRSNRRLSERAESPSHASARPGLFMRRRGLARSCVT